MTGTTVSRAEGAHFEEGLRAFFAYRDLGVKAATGGAFAAHVIRAIPGRHSVAQWHTHDLGFQFTIVLKGWVRFEYEDIGEVTFRQGDSVYQPPMVRHRELGHSEDLELLEIVSPAEFVTKADAD
ncbi:cupin domain-containing protein [Humitalea sp. 24SJ18S-53]|uniref:cupin domain-containing protein n=1 Tax=Humitalea sp. 24SJ18S-53 TaxID=3422307 RepID=UPI003D67182F